ncbi:MAG: hypothetical protein RL095_483 [Verrucomicrobiota bacterium]|jgi:hypothetical protein
MFQDVLNALLQWGADFIKLLLDGFVTLCNFFLQFVLQLITDAISHLLCIDGPEIDIEAFAALFNIFAEVNKYVPLSEMGMMLICLTGNFLAIFTLRLILKAIPTVW